MTVILLQLLLLIVIGTCIVLHLLFCTCLCVCAKMTVINNYLNNNFIFKQYISFFSITIFASFCLNSIYTYYCYEVCFSFFPQFFPFFSFTLHSISHDGSNSASCFGALTCSSICTSLLLCAIYCVTYEWTLTATQDILCIVCSYHSNHMHLTIAWFVCNRDCKVQKGEEVQLFASTSFSSSKTYYLHFEHY